MPRFNYILFSFYLLMDRKKLTKTYVLKTHSSQQYSAVFQNVKKNYQQIEILISNKLIHFKFVILRAENS